MYTFTVFKHIVTYSLSVTNSMLPNSLKVTCSGGQKFPIL